MPDQRSSRRRRRDDEHTMPPVTERTMFPYRRDEARRERAQQHDARQHTTPPQQQGTQQYDPQLYDTSTYPPSPWPSPQERPGRADRSAQTYPGGLPGGRPAVPNLPRPPQGETGPYQTGSFPIQSTSGQYPAPPRPGLSPRGSAAAAPSAPPSWAPQNAPVAPPPSQPVPTRPGQSRGAQARVTQPGAAPVEAPRSPWPAQPQQARGAYQVEQARPTAQPGPRWEPDHTGQTGPHTWPPVPRDLSPELDEATQLASVQDLRPKPAAPPEYDDRALDQGTGANRRGRPLPGGAELASVYDDLAAPPRRAAAAPAKPARPVPAKGAPAKGGKKGRGKEAPAARSAAARELDLDGADLASANYGADFAADYSVGRSAGEEHQHEEPAERSLISAWLVFLLETVVAAGVGLSAWIGFHHLWRTQPLIAAAGCGVVLVGLHAVVGFIRRRQTGHAMDLFSSAVVVAVGVAITVLPAAFAIKPT